MMYIPRGRSFIEVAFMRRPNMSYIFAPSSISGISCTLTSSTSVVPLLRPRTKPAYTCLR